MRAPNHTGALCLASLLTTLAASPAASWESQSASSEWGTAAASGVGGLSSAELHSLGGQVAAQVNAADLGLLLGSGLSLSVTSIGAQNIVSTTIVGDSNDVNVDVGSQDSSNTGSISNSGAISVGDINQ